MLNWSLKCDNVNQLQVDKVLMFDIFFIFFIFELKCFELCIVFVFGGGVVCGWVYIGVFCVFDEEGIKIGMVVGILIGVLVGGCYLVGKFDEFESFVWLFIMCCIVVFFDFMIGGGGLLGGLRFMKCMQEYFEGLLIDDFDCFFVVVVMELKIGYEVWMYFGLLIIGICVFYVFFGIFELIICNGWVLVDGVLVNFVFVFVCCVYEQQFVVVVNFYYDFYGCLVVIKYMVVYQFVIYCDMQMFVDKEQCYGVMLVMVEVFNIIQDCILWVWFVGDFLDLLLQFWFVDIGLLEFYCVGEVIDCGYFEVKVKIGEIKCMQDVLLC